MKTVTKSTKSDSTNSTSNADVEKAFPGQQKGIKQNN